MDEKEKCLKFKRHFLEVKEIGRIFEKLKDPKELEEIIVRVPTEITTMVD